MLSLPREGRQSQSAQITMHYAMADALADFLSPTDSDWRHDKRSIGLWIPNSAFFPQSPSMPSIKPIFADALMHAMLGKMF